MSNLLQSNIFGLVLVVLQIYILSLTSSYIQSSLYYFLRKIMVPENISIYIVSIFFVIGTLIHELSHAVTCLFLGGRVGTISLLPQQVGSTEIRYGQVEVEKLDPLRNTLIGIAPLIWGILLIILFSSLISLQDLELLDYVLLFLIFQISNSMFLSNSDLVYFKILFGIFFIVILSFLLFDYLYLNNLVQYWNKISEFFWSKSLRDIFNVINFSLIIPVIFNLIITIFSKFISFIVKRY